MTRITLHTASQAPITLTIEGDHSAPIHLHLDAASAPAPMASRPAMPPALEAGAPQKVGRIFGSRRQLVICGLALAVTLGLVSYNRLSASAPAVPDYAPMNLPPLPGTGPVALTERPAPRTATASEEGADILRSLREPAHVVTPPAPSGNQSAQSPFGLEN